MKDVYQPPTLTAIGDYRELTHALVDGICEDFAGWGFAVVCVW